MVTHELRMTQYVDRVIQMVDGKLYQVIDERAEIDALAAGGRFEAVKPVPRVEEAQRQNERVISVIRNALAAEG